MARGPLLAHFSSQLYTQWSVNLHLMSPTKDTQQKESAEGVLQAWTKLETEI
jgi:hypothetical protein